jgi:iron complex outermembrane recepter protein
LGVLLSFAIAPALGKTAAVAPAKSGLSDELRWLKAEKIIVTSVSKHPEDAFTAGAAVSVITSEELRRSGVRTLANALRLAPGMQVANVNSNVWSISARGFNDQFSTKLLVLIDGRAVYSPAIMGIYWHAQDSLFEDVERIEIVRGPGGTLWGSNAVTGVVNVITKPAQNSQGTYLTGGLGTEQRRLAGVRHGDKLGQHGTYRVYVKFDEYDDSRSSGLAPPLAPRPALGAAHDSWNHLMTGMRADWVLPNDTVALHADYFRANVTSQLFVPNQAAFANAVRNEVFPLDGFNLVSKWTHLLPNDTEWQLQGYYDYLQRPSDIFNYRYHSVDVDFQHRLRLRDRHEITYGANYRFYADHQKRTNPDLYYIKPKLFMQMFSAFVQDDVSLIPDLLQFVFGTKAEHNYFSGWELQPSIRLVATPSPYHTLWAAVSRAVRTPSRTDRHVRINTLTPALGIFPRGFGNPDFESEKLLAYEFGYRVKPLERLTLDFTSYYFRYADLFAPVAAPERISFPFGPPAPAVVPIDTIGNGKANSYGLEFAQEFRAFEWWRLRSAYTFFAITDLANQHNRPNATPKHAFLLRSSMDLPRNVELDLWSRWTDKVPSRRLEQFWDLDVRLAWRPTARWECAVVGQNLLHRQRRQFAPPDLTLATVVTEIQRGVYAQVTFRH